MLLNDDYLQSCEYALGKTRCDSAIPLGAHAATGLKGMDIAV